MEVIKKVSLFLLLICMVTEMDAQFLGTNNLYYGYYNSEKTQLKVCATSGNAAYSGDIVIPETATITDESITEGNQTISLPVVAIDGNAFSGATDLTSINIPASITNIGDNAFRDCSGLKRAIFKSSNDFCRITFGNKEANPLYYAHHLYVDNNEVTVIDVPAGPVEISAGAFAGGSEITKITIPESVNYIGTDAFYGCNNNNLTISYATETQMKTMNYGKGESNPMSKAKMFLVGGQEITEVSFDADVHESGFKGAAWLLKVTLNSGVTKIGDEAFLGCNKLTTVIFNGTDITEIGNNAFNNCQKLSIVKSSEDPEKNELPATLEVLGRSAFRYCINLKNITIPNTVTSIGKETFYSCSGLLEVDLQADITTIPESMFNGCTKLSQVTLSSSIKTVDFRAFYGCSALTGLPNVTTIGQEAYANCKGFTILTLPTTITTIGVKAFASCQNLTDLIIPEEVTGLNISTQAFYAEAGKGSLKHIYSYPMTAPCAHWNAFEGQTGVQLYYTDGSSGYNDEPWNTFSSTFFNKQTITWYLDDDIDNYYQTEVQVGDLIPEIPDPSRAGWTFAKWQWPNGNELTLMPDYPLELRGYFTAQKTHETTGLTYSLRSDNKQATVVEDEDVNKTIEAVVIGPSVTFDNIEYPIVAINAHAFKGAKKLKSADLSNATLTSIGNAIFAECTNLETAKVPTQITIIPDSLFYGCNNLVNINMPNGIVKIGVSAFNDCATLNIDKLPSKVEVIGEAAFSKSGISSMTLPESINTMGSRIFSYCPNLKEVVFENDMQLTTLPDNTFQNCTKLITFTLPSSTKTIGGNAFTGCSSLERIVLDNTGIQTISANAFTNCNSLKEIILPASIETIGNSAFENCTNIGLVAIHSAEPPATPVNAFSEEIFGKASLFVTDVDKYNAKTPWSSFSSIKQLLDNHSGSLEYTITYIDEKDNKVIYVDHLFYGATIVEPKEQLKKDGYRYVITPEIETIGTMPAEIITFNVTYYETEADWTPTKNNPNGLTYHIYTEGHNPHAELIAGNTPYTGGITVPATITYMNDEDVYPVTAIRANAFKDCFNMTSVSLPESITSIGTQAFTGCYKLVEITIPKNVETLGTEVFLRCSGLKKVYFNDESKLEALPSYTFMDCKALETIDLHSSLKTISNEVFRGCKALEKITIPRDVTRIGDNAFQDCNKLERITIENQTALPEAYETTFEETTYDVATLVVSATVQAHRTSPWDKFEAELGGETDQKCATPTIEYDKGTLTFKCAKPAGAEIKSEITVSDATKTDGADTQRLNKKYVITAYATAVGWKRSDVATATITWQDGKLCETTGFDGDVGHEEVEGQQQGLPGDRNGDGQVTAEDAALILKLLVGKSNN